VNNAGIPAAGPLELFPLDELRRVLEVNLIGAVAVTQAFLPLLKASRGRIVNMSSVAGVAPCHSWGRTRRPSSAWKRFRTVCDASCCRSVSA